MMLRRGNAWALLFGLGAPLGCGNDPFSATEERQLVAARARWDTAALQDYQVDVRLGCFCQGAVPFFTRITVQEGQVVAAAPLESSPGFENIPLSVWPTVPEVFAWVEGAANQSSYERIEVRFDSELGYPQRVELECKPDILDCGAVYELQNLVAGQGQSEAVEPETRGCRSSCLDPQLAALVDVAGLAPQERSARTGVRAAMMRGEPTFRL